LFKKPAANAPTGQNKSARQLPAPLNGAPVANINSPGNGAGATFNLTFSLPLLDINADGRAWATNYQI
jgi:hypothetical protein